MHRASGQEAKVLETFGGQCRAEALLINGLVLDYPTAEHHGSGDSQLAGDNAYLGHHKGDRPLKNFFGRGIPRRNSLEN